MNIQMLFFMLMQIIIINIMLNVVFSLDMGLDQDAIDSFKDTILNKALPILL